MSQQEKAQEEVNINLEWLRVKFKMFTFFRIMTVLC